MYLNYLILKIWNAHIRFILLTVTTFCYTFIGYEKG